MFRILSLDGGGIRGIIPALVLAELERRTGKPVAQLFDLIAGTSTGGILALGLVRPDEGGRPRYRAEDLVALYQHEGRHIFSRSPWHRMRALGNLADERYPSAGVDEVLAKRFADARLTDALVDVLVTSYDIELRSPHFFKSHRARKDPARDFLLRDAARATSAAPTYFEPARIRLHEGSPALALVDGGVFANNPAACALVEAICDFGARPESTLLLSLGTGQHTRPIPFEEARGWGLARWAQPILDVVFDGVSDTVDYQVASILGPRDGREHYLRIQTALDEGSDEMDDASEENLEALGRLARELIERHDADLDRWAELLGRPQGTGPHELSRLSGAAEGGEGIELPSA